MSKKNKKHWFGSIRNMEIARRITLLYGGLFSFSLIIISLLMTLGVSAVQQHNIREEIADIISDIRIYIKSGSELNEDALNDILDSRYVEVSVYSHKDNVCYYSHMGDLPSFVQTPETALRQSAQGDTAESSEYARIDASRLGREGFNIKGQKENDDSSTEYILENVSKQQFMLVSTDITTEDNIYTIEAFKLIDIDSSLIKGFIVRLLIIDMLGILAAVLAGKYISWRMLQPVENIRAAAERITIEDLSQRIEVDGPDDEMKELTVTFNSMIDRLETSFMRQNQFVSDASHELRTPISVIQGYASLINRWGKSDPDILQESIDSILSETEHMSELIKKLLFLAKSDQNRMLVQKQQISLNEAAAEIVRELEVMEVKRNIILVEDDEAEIWADPDLIKQLLWIHAENAIKYTNDDGNITIRVWKDKKNAFISVSDNGVGIAEEDQAKIFDRFYRADKSRNKEISGTGLGLSIAKWIVDSHDGQVFVESQEGEGTTFIDRFKLYSGEKPSRTEKPNTDQTTEKAPAL